MREFTKEDLDREYWKPLKGYEKYCEASNLGRIKTLDRISIDKNGHKFKIKSRILTLGYYSNGYEQFSISVDNRRHTGIAHRLIAMTFIPNPKNLAEVNHKNGIKDDNKIENLEWCSAKENINHSFKVLKRKSGNHKGEKNIKSKLSKEDVLNIRSRLAKGENKENVFENYKTKISFSAFSKVLYNNTWKHLPSIKDMQISSLLPL